VTPATGFDDGWWRDFSVVTICQAMSNVTSDIRPQIKQPDVNNQVSNSFAALKPKLNTLYKQLLISIQQSPAAVPFSQIGSGNLGQAATLYQGFLSNPAWVVAKKAQFASGQWTNQVWELLHHWLKLWSLGVSTGSIDTLIGQLAAAGDVADAGIEGGVDGLLQRGHQRLALLAQRLPARRTGILDKVDRASRSRTQPPRDDVTGKSRAAGQRHSNDPIRHHDAAPV